MYKLDMAPTKTPGAPRGTIRGTSSHGIVNFTIRAAPIPAVILDFILENLVTFKKLYDRSIQHQQQNGHPSDELEEEGTDLYGDVIRKPSVTQDQFWEALHEVCKSAGGEWENITDKIWALGPRSAGGCLLIDARKPKAFAS
jgi:ribosome assembly protein 1